MKKAASLWLEKEQACYLKYFVSAPLVLEMSDGAFVILGITTAVRLINLT